MQRARRLFAILAVTLPLLAGCANARLFTAWVASQNIAEVQRPLHDRTVRMIVRPTLGGTAVHFNRWWSVSQ